MSTSLMFWFIVTYDDLRELQFITITETFNTSNSFQLKTTRSHCAPAHRTILSIHPPRGRY